jgi:UDP-GlcNAc:undecaprenyl-phosphate GlcNAc-1-phosphate transferase
MHINLLYAELSAGTYFLGDAGAYTLGFLLAVSLITLHSKHIEISVWSILLLIFWPLADMGHSIFRRRLHGKRSDRPDKLHFHHVIMRSLVILSRGCISQQWANLIATAIILPMMGLPVALGVVYNKNNEVCIALFFEFMWFFTLAHYCVIAVTRRRIWVAESVKKLSFTETN